MHLYQTTNLPHLRLVCQQKTVDHIPARKAQHMPLRSYITLHTESLFDWNHNRITTASENEEMNVQLLILHTEE